MDLLARFEPFIHLLLTLIISLIVIPFLGRIYRLHKEQSQMIRKKLLEHTGVVIFGVFDGKVQSDYLGGFLTALFGETLFDLIVTWNDAPSPNLIIPRTAYQSEHLKEILAAHASPYLLQSARIDCYFQGVEAYGSPSYQFTKLVVGLARPDANKLTSHDYPRVIIIELGTLKKIVGGDVAPQWETPDGHLWLETVRDLGKNYLSGKVEGIAVLEMPLGPTKG